MATSCKECPYFTVYEGIAGTPAPDDYDCRDNSYYERFGHGTTDECGLAITSVAQAAILDVELGSESEEN